MQYRPDCVWSGCGVHTNRPWTPRTPLPNSTSCSRLPSNCVFFVLMETRENRKRWVSWSSSAHLTRSNLIRRAFSQLSNALVSFVKRIFNESNIAKNVNGDVKDVKKDCRNLSALSAFTGQEHIVTRGTESTVSGRRIGMIMMGTREALALTQVSSKPPRSPEHQVFLQFMILVFIDWPDWSIKTPNLQLNADIILEIYVSIKKSSPFRGTRRSLCEALCIFIKAVKGMEGWGLRSWWGWGGVEGQTFQLFTC